MCAGSGHDSHRCPDGVEVVLLEVLAEKLIRNGYFHPGIADVQDAQRPDPGVQHFGRKAAIEGTEQLLMKIVTHGEPSYGRKLHTHLSTAVDNFGIRSVLA